MILTHFSTAIRNNCTVHSSKYSNSNYNNHHSIPDRAAYVVVTTALPVACCDPLICACEPPGAPCAAEAPNKKSVQMYK